MEKGGLQNNPTNSWLLRNGTHQRAAGGDGAAGGGILTNWE